MRSRMWVGYVVLTSIASFAFLALPASGRVVVHLGLNAAVLVAMILGIRAHAPVRPAGWWVVVASLVVYALASVIWFPSQLRLSAPMPFPSVADGAWIAAHVLLGCGIFVLAGPGARSRENLLDALTLAAGLGILAWVTLVEPYIEDTTLSVLARVVAASYPMLDVGLVAIAAVLLPSSSGARTASRLIVLALVGQLCGDAVYDVRVLHGTWGFDWTDVLWLSTLIFLGAAALHPSMRSLGVPTSRRTRGSGRLTMLVAGVAAGMVAIIVGARSGASVLELIWPVSPLLVVASVRLRGLLVDVDRYRAVVADLATAEADYRGLFANAMEGIYRTTVDGRNTIANPALVTILGYESPEHLTADVPDVSTLYVDPAERAVFFELLDGQGLVNGFEYRVRRRDGCIIWVSENARAIRDDDGRLVGAEGSLVDVTDRKVAEATLRRRDAILEAVGAAASRLLRVGDWEDQLEEVLESVGRATSANRVSLYENRRDEEGVSLAVPRASWQRPGVPPRAAATGRGFRVDELDDARPGSLRAGLPLRASVGDLRPAVREAVASPDAGVITIVPVLVGEEWWGFVCIEESLDEDGSVGVSDAEVEALVAAAALLGAAIARRRVEEDVRALNRDLERRVEERTADLRAANAALGAAKDEAERANRAKSEFLSRVSHELRTPLNAILGFGQLLEASPVAEHDPESIHQILKAGAHLLDLINEVLDISRIETGRLSLSIEAVSVDEVLREVVDLMRPLAAERAIELRVAGEAGTWVRADHQRLKQVVLNLVSNAVKYNVDGGLVTIRWNAAEWVSISVEDTGPGIAPELLPRLFSPFDRLGAETSSAQGTGLGLALSRSLVEAMSGEIQVDSHPGSGSVFAVRLARAAEPSAPDAMEIDDGSSGTILYIEDNLANVRLLERVLADGRGIRLMTAMQGRLGIEVARQHRPDAILLDLHLPDMPGREVLRELKADPATSTIPVVVMSADISAHLAYVLRTDGAEDLIPKPIDVARLLEVVERLPRLERSGER